MGCLAHFFMVKWLKSGGKWCIVEILTGAVAEFLRCIAQDESGDGHVYRGISKLHRRKRTGHYPF